MKAAISFVCIIFLVFSIAGCSRAAEPTPVAQQQAQETQAPEAQPAIAEQPAQQPAPEPVSAPAGPASPVHTVSKATGVSALVGNWSLEGQYAWDPEAKQWAPGIVLDDGTVTEVPPEMIITEILQGVDSDWCPDAKAESGAEYVTIVPGGCWKVTGSAMVAVDIPPEEGSGSMAWEIRGSTLEMDITFKDASGAETDRNKAVLARLQ